MWLFSKCRDHALMHSHFVIYREIFTGEYFGLAVNHPDYSPVNKCLVRCVHIDRTVSSPLDDFELRCLSRIFTGEYSNRAELG